MTRQTTWCRCCQQTAARTLCEPCGQHQAGHDSGMVAIITRLFGSLGREQFEAALRAQRLAARRARRRGRQETETLL